MSAAERLERTLRDATRHRMARPDALPVATLEAMRRLRGGYTDPWVEVLSNPEAYGPALSLLCEIYSLKPEAHWGEALRLRVFPDLQRRNRILDPAETQRVETAFVKRTAGEAESWSASCLLLIDVGLWLIHEQPTDGPFSRLADLTRNVEFPALRVAHCIRDIAFGQERRASDLQGMLHSKERGYRDLFEKVIWEEARRKR
jgi:hypothetical protein